MRKIKIDISLEDYTDNVRRIIERSLHDLEAEPLYLTSFFVRSLPNGRRLRDGATYPGKGRNRINKTKIN